MFVRSPMTIPFPRHFTTCNYMAKDLGLSPQYPCRRRTCSQALSYKRSEGSEYRQYCIYPSQKQQFLSKNLRIQLQFINWRWNIPDECGLTIIRCIWTNYYQMKMAWRIQWAFCPTLGRRYRAYQTGVEGAATAFAQKPTDARDSVRDHSWPRLHFPYLHRRHRGVTFPRVPKRALEPERWDRPQNPLEKLGID